MMEVLSNMAEPITAEYAAGFFDGEGSVGIWIRGGNTRHGKPRKEGYHPRASMANTYRPVLEAFQERWGGRIEQVPSTKPQHRDRFYWRLNVRNDLAQFLEDVMPHLQEKQERAVNVWMACAGLRDLEHARAVHQRIMGVV
jgi:hypothetical protein